MAVYGVWALNKSRASRHNHQGLVLEDATAQGLIVDHSGVTKESAWEYDDLFTSCEMLDRDDFWVS